MDTFEDMAKKTVEKINNEAVFKVNDIVYLLADYGKSPSMHYPSIGSASEIDLKVTKVYCKPAMDFVIQANLYYYDLLSGHGIEVQAINESFLISPKDKILGVNKEVLLLKESCELAKAGTLFVREGDYWTSAELGISIHHDRMLTLTGIFENYKHQR